MTRFIGTTEECIEHLVENFSTDVLRPVMADFCRVDTTTVRRWLARENMPGGDPLVALRVFLQLADYGVDELDDLTKSTRTLAQVVAVGERTVDEVRIALNYSNPQEVYRVILRGSSMVRERQDRLHDLLAETQVDLDRKLNLWGPRIREALNNARPSGVSKPTAHTPATSAEAPTAVEVSSENFVVNPSMPMQALVVDHLITALSAALDAGDRQRGDVIVPQPLPEHQRKAITSRLGEDRRQRLIAQLEMLA